MDWVNSPFHSIDMGFKLCSNVLVYAIGQMCLIMLYTLANNTLLYNNDDPKLVTVLFEDMISNS